MLCLYCVATLRTFVQGVRRRFANTRAFLCTSSPCIRVLPSPCRSAYRSHATSVHGMTEHTGDQTIRCALLQVMESKWFEFSARRRPTLVDARLVRILLHRVFRALILR